MKISIIGPGLMPIPPKGWGAVESLIWDMANALKDLGQEVQIINTTDGNKVLAAINEFNPDFVHINYDDFIVLYPHITQPKAMTSHFGYLERPDMMNGYVNIFNKFQDMKPNVFCLSEGIKNIYKVFSNFPEEKLFVTPNGVNVDAFNLKNLESMKDAIRRNTDWTETCEAYREQAKDFLDEMGYEQNKDSNYNVSEAKDINKIAKAVIVKDNKALILLRAGSEKNADKWDLPGGHLNEGEELMEGLLREVYEETGLTLAEPVESLYTKENISFFKAGMPQEDIKLSHEHTKYKFISVDEIPENISSRFIKAIKATL